jgi:DNA-binding response OmpR family regulator
MTEVMKKRTRDRQSNRRTPLIVCIDDDPHILKAVRLRLQSLNLDVLQASNGHDGVKLIQDRKPDLVISDWWMDNGDGEYVLNEMQNETETAQIPVIMVSGVARPDFSSRMFAQGARSCHTKPINFEALSEDLCIFLDLDLSELKRTRPSTSRRGGGLRRPLNDVPGGERIRFDRLKTHDPNRR